MAFEITNKVTTLPLSFVPRERFELADQTATTAGQDAKTASRTWRAVVYQKAFTAGTGTRMVQYAIEVADNSAMSTNLRGIATGMVQRADEQTLVLIGQTPFSAGQQFGRVKIILDATDTATFDAILEAA